MSWQPENAAETALLAAIRAGTWARLSGQKGPLRAGLLRALMLGQVAGVVLPPEGLRVQDAVVDGLLDLEGCGSPEAPLPALQLLGCNRGEDTPRLSLDLSRAALRLLDLRRCRLAALLAGWVRLSDGLWLGGADALGELNFIGASIGGDATFSGASLRNPDARALIMDRVRLNGSLFLRGTPEAPTLVEGEVRLLGASIDGNVDAAGASLRNPRGNALSMDSARLTGNLFLRGSADAPTLVDGAVRLLCASIGGDVDAGGASLRNKGGDALQMDSAQLSGSLFLRGADARTIVEGEIRLRGASIGGAVSASGVSLRNPGGNTLSMDGCRLTGGVFLRAAELEGGLSLAFVHFERVLDIDGASVAGALDLDGSYLGELRARDTRITPPAGTVETILSAANARLGGALRIALRDSHGIIDLRGAQVGLLDDDGGRGWGSDGPHAPNRAPGGGALQGVQLRLDGFTYQRFEPPARRNWLAERIDFLRRQFCGQKPGRDDFLPQPWEQAARTLRAMGHPAEADEIARAKRDFQAECGVDRWGRRVWSRLMGLCFGHFYQPGRAIITLLLCIWLGGDLLARANNAGFLARKPDAIELRQTTPPQWQPCWIWPQPSSTSPIIGLEALIMGLDLLLPLVDLKQNERCEVKDWRAANEQRPTDAVAEAFWSSVLALVAALGFIVIPLFIATVSGLARKE